MKVFSLIHSLKYSLSSHLIIKSLQFPAPQPFLLKESFFHIFLLSKTQILSGLTYSVRMKKLIPSDFYFFTQKPESFYYVCGNCSI